MKKKIALITGITGQDGSYLAEFLLKKNYIVHGIKRRSSSFNTARIDHIYKDLQSKKNNFFLHYGDLSDSNNLTKIIKQILPNEIYNLAAQSHVAVSFESPEYTANVDGLGTLRLLESIRILGLEKKVKFYQASSSELFGKVLETPQNENTPFNPQSPYAVAKLYSFWICKNYRDAYKMFICNGILFNHESYRRGETFVTRKITMAVAKIVLNKKKTMFIGNLNAKRDWGHAKDYVEMQWLMMQQKKPEDYVISTGKQYSVKDFINLAAKNLDLKIDWEGKNLKEVGLINGKKVIRVDSRYFRPTEVQTLLGDSTKAKKKLGWSPKISFEELVKEMIEKDLEKAKNEK